MKTISAYRIIEMLKEKNIGTEQEFSILKETQGILNRHYIVKKNWKQDLEKNKKVEVLAEYRIDLTNENKIYFFKIYNYFYISNSKSITDLIFNIEKQTVFST